MAELDFVGVLTHLQGWLGEPVAMSAGSDAPGGPLDVLSLHGVLQTGWDLQLPGQSDGAVFVSIEGDQGSGLMLERSSFLRAEADAEQLVLWTVGGVRVSVELVDR